jgi:DNA-binding NtrC family response regulator
MDHLEATDTPRYPDLIYVVEDDPDVSQLIEHNLRTAGYEVSTFFSGGQWFPWQPRRNRRCFFSILCFPG